jgi:hypothetical protein
MSTIRARFVLPNGTALTRSLQTVPDTGHLVRLERDGAVYVAAPPEHLVGGLPYVTIRLTPALEHRDDEPSEPAEPDRAREALEAIARHGAMPDGESWEVAYHEVVAIANEALDAAPAS